MCDEARKCDPLPRPKATQQKIVNSQMTKKLQLPDKGFKITTIHKNFGRKIKKWVKGWKISAETFKPQKEKQMRILELKILISDKITSWMG